MPLRVRFEVPSRGAGAVVVIEGGTRAASVFFFNWLLVTVGSQFVKILVLLLLDVHVSACELYIN